jgi:hypothetical protein
VDGEDIRSSGLEQASDGLRWGAVVVCKWTDSPTMDCLDVCMVAFWLQEWEWLPQEVLLEEFYRSECSETVRVGRLRVFEELLAVFNCSVLTYGEQ